MASLTLTRRTGTEAGGWRWGWMLAAGVVAVVYLVNVALSDVRPGNAWGIVYGVGAAVLLVLAALFAVRRRSMRVAARVRLGRSRTWLRLHVYGSLLFLLLVLMHTGFRLPQGILSWWLWVLSLWTVGSGLIGLLLQRWIPRALNSGLAIEVLYERIPELIDEIRERAEGLAAGCSPPVQALYARNMAPSLAGPSRELIYWLDITGGIRSRLKEIEYLRGLLPAEEKEKLTELERLYRTKLEIDAHYTLQQALRW